MLRDTFTEDMEACGYFGAAILPYGSMVANLERLLNKVGIKTVFRPFKKINQCMQPVDLGLKVPGVFEIPYFCGSTYIGQMGRSIVIQCKERQLLY